MSEPVKIAVVVKGGMVEEILTAGVPVEAVIVDHDTWSADTPDIVTVDGFENEATLTPAKASDSEDDRKKVLAAFEAAQ